jgi:ribosomal protein S18 acetylase RimI-like enzyme
MSLEIRLAVRSDVSDLFRVRTSARENHLSMVRLSRMGITEISIAEMISASPCAWVAISGNEIVGFSMIDIDEGSLFAAFVLPSQEGKGIGRQLVQAAEEKLFEHHAHIWLETAKTSRAAGFYRHLGWNEEQDVGTRDIRLTKRRVKGPAAAPESTDLR